MQPGLGFGPRPNRQCPSARSPSSLGARNAARDKLHYKPGRVTYTQVHIRGTQTADNAYICMHSDITRLQSLFYCRLARALEALNPIFTKNEADLPQTQSQLIFYPQRQHRKICLRSQIKNTQDTETITQNSNAKIYSIGLIWFTCNVTSFRSILYFSCSGLSAMGSISRLSILLKTCRFHAVFIWQHC